MWIEFHYEQKDDQRIEKLARSLRIARPYALGHLTLMRAWAASEKFRAFTGDISGFTPEKLSEAAEYSPGDPQAPLRLVKALIDCELVIRDPAAPEIQPGEPLGGHASFADWLEFCGEAVKKRIERRQTPADNGGQTADKTVEGLLLSLASNGSRVSNAVWSLFLVLKYIKKGKDKASVKDDTRWDLLNKDRQLPWLKKVLDAYEGDVKKAARAVFEMGEHYEQAGLSWDAATIHKRLTDWEEGRLNGR